MRCRISNTRLFSQVILACLVLALAGPAQAADSIFNGLQKNLSTQGFKKKELDKLFKHPALKFEAKTMARFLSITESKLDYAQFLNERTVSKAKLFVKRHGKTLAAAKAKTGVPPEVVVSILSVESRLGAYTGKYRVFNMLASQAVLLQKDAQDRLRKYWPSKKKKYLKSAKFKARIKWRAKWAGQELAMLLRLAKAEKRDPHSYRGSVAGAMGMGQFVPSSARRFGRDGDLDGVVDLAKPADAINSVAAFLAGHGWKPGLSRKQAEKVVYAYNRSTPYVQTILALAKRIEK